MPGDESNHQPKRERAGSALCLSGGGFRAALFHLGALRRLNELGLLSKMRTISSVSGGSVANGLLARLWRELKPDPSGSGKLTNFSEYERKLREFCGRDIRTGPLLTERLLSPIAALREVARRYGARFLVTAKPQAGVSPIFENGSYHLYDLDHNR